MVRAKIALRRHLHGFFPANAPVQPFSASEHPDLERIDF
jgi:hypothetical protein